jgi:hypothetical protein
VLIEKAHQSLQAVKIDSADQECVKNSNVSKFIDIKPKDVQEDVSATETEQILALNLTLATAEGVIVQSDTLVVDEGTTMQSNASVVN